jgi:hypothetical protein
MIEKEARDAENPDNILALPLLSLAVLRAFLEALSFPCTAWRAHPGFRCMIS